jgi:acylphosphatase
MPDKRIAVFFSGRVQGVGFRFYARDIAQSLMLTGWVSNCSNRDVECEVQGNETDVDVFCERMKDGPPLARVCSMRINNLPIVPGETSFDILY